MFSCVFFSFFFQRTYNGYPISAGYFGSYCLDGLAMALWGVYHTTTFDQAVISVVTGPPFLTWD